MKDKKNTKHHIGTVLNKECVAGYVFIMPFIIGFLIFTAIPIISSFYFSFTSYDILSSPVFIGLKNFADIFKDPKFFKSFSVTFLYALFSVPARLIAALLVAILLVKKTKLSGFYRAVYYLPSIMGGSIAVAVLWKRLFAGSDGMLNSMLRAIGINCDIVWLGNPNTALFVLILLAAWQFGSSMLIFLAGLQQVPPSLYEAAIIDGAGAWKKFIKITLPMLSPVIFFNLVMQIINGFMAFTQSYVITAGKPLDSTLFYSVYLYQRAFAYSQVGYASALAWILLLVIAVLTGIVFKSSSAWVFYETEMGGKKK